jgi:hypothetical protein
MKTATKNVAWELSNVKKLTTSTDDLVTLAKVVKASEGLLSDVTGLRRLYRRNVLVRPTRINGKVYYKKEYVDSALSSYYLMKNVLNLSTQVTKTVLGANRGKEKALVATLKEFITNTKGACSTEVENKFIASLKKGDTKDNVIPKDVIKRRPGRPRKVAKV